MILFHFATIFLFVIFSYLSGLSYESQLEDQTPLSEIIIVANFSAVLIYRAHGTFLEGPALCILHTRVFRILLNSVQSMIAFWMLCPSYLFIYSPSEIFPLTRTWMYLVYICKHEGSKNVIHWWLFIEDASWLTCPRTTSISHSHRRVMAWSHEQHSSSRYFTQGYRDIFLHWIYSSEKKTGVYIYFSTEFLSLSQWSSQYFYMVVPLNGVSVRLSLHWQVW